MNPFANRFSNQQWVVPVTGMCLVLGFMISMAWLTETNRSSRLSLLPPDQRNRLSAGAVDIEKFQELSAQVGKLQKEKTELENALAAKGSDSEILNKSLQEVKAFAGLTELEGPGVVVTLRDNPSATQAVTNFEGNPDEIIHDIDVLKVVNELFSAGAEGVSVNNIRVSSGSSFRCVGPTILVNDVKIASPVVIRAIGDADALYGGLKLPGGVLAEIWGINASMATIEKAKTMRLPAFVGSTSKRVGRVPKATP